MAMRAGLVFGLLVSGLVAVSAAAQPPQRKPTPNDRLISLEVSADHKVTFRIYAPKASEVTVRGDWMTTLEPVKLTKDDQGVWSASVGPLTPDFYSYSF